MCHDRPVPKPPTYQKELDRLSKSFHDQALWLRAGHANGKMIPNMLNLAQVIEGLERLTEIVKVLDKRE